MGGKNQTSFKKGHACPWAKKIGDKLRGRNLKEQIVVHHINGNNKDNCPENLIKLTRSEHALLHNRQGEVGFQKGTTAGKYGRSGKPKGGGGDLRN